uniref:Acetyltransferase n=1 Tax=Solibacter usitatus (strain Ellin6076) TaxID=234267 RepID=Q028N9_SOLUE
MAMVPRTNQKGLVRKAEILACTCLATGLSLSAQVLMPASGPGGPVRLFTSDAAILEAREVRKDIPCSVTPVKPVLGFDLKFHAGYDVSVPLKELAGSDNQLTMVFRVTPDQKPDEATYFSQRWNVPAIDADAGGSAVLSGIFDVGEGKYHVDWLMRDRSERICSNNWDADAALPPRDKQIALDIAPSAVQPAETELFKQEPAVHRESREDALNVKVMVNFAPQDSLSATLQPIDTNALLSILRSIAREPRIVKFSIVAFNMQEQRVIYRQEESAQIDFPALGEAIHSLNLGTVDLKRLSQKHGDAEFLAGFIAEEIKKEDKEQPDAVIIAGPKVTVDGGLPQESLKQMGDLKFPVFYMNYNLNPQVNPWRDAIGVAVKTLKGAEFTISRPRDVFFAWTEIIGRIVKSKIGRTSTASASAR